MKTQSAQRPGITRKPDNRIRMTERRFLGLTSSIWRAAFIAGRLHERRARP